jgi:secondary thiamine-phosphate synthase enzyme
MLKKIPISTKSRDEFIDVTGSVQAVVNESGVGEGVCIIYVPHTTAGVTVNENADPSVSRDILTMLARLVPHGDKSYRHTEGNSDSHIKSALVGFSHAIPISGSKLALGTWQGIFFCEFDGPRQRSLLIQVIAEKV